ncbi:MAG TPA: ECF-type sigma factor [Gemmatimonadales bacterium]|nr:ECF-type sigma factor [Gemmatimonadales bacterium]
MSRSRLCCFRRRAGRSGLVHQALQRLAAVDDRRSRILEERYFGGLSLEEIAEALDVSLATVKRELRAARAWLAVELRPDAPGDPGADV